MSPTAVSTAANGSTKVPGPSVSVRRAQSKLAPRAAIDASPPWMEFTICTVAVAVVSAVARGLPPTFRQADAGVSGGKKHDAQRRLQRGGAGTGVGAEIDLQHGRTPRTVPVAVAGEAHVVAAAAGAIDP